MKHRWDELYYEWMLFRRLQIVFFSGHSKGFVRCEVGMKAVSL